MTIHRCHQCGYLGPVEAFETGCPDCNGTENAICANSINQLMEQSLRDQRQIIFKAAVDLMDNWMSSMPGNKQPNLAFLSFFKQALRRQIDEAN